MVSAAQAPAAELAPNPSVARQWRPSPRLVLLVFGLAVLLVGALVGYALYRQGLDYISTDNAQVSGEPVQVGSLNAGRVRDINVFVGAAVHRNDVLASIALPTQTGIAQNGQPELTFLGNADGHVDVLAPLDGVVIAVIAPVGSTVSPGQTIVSIVDPRHLWVNANLEETSLARVKVGQAAQVHIDALNEDIPGRVAAITPATASSSSLLPTNPSSGNFTKVVQQVPVRIAVDLTDRTLLLGGSAEVKIHAPD